MSDVSTWLFVISTLGLNGLLFYKLWTFFNFKQYAFYECLIREGTLLISTTVVFTMSFLISMLNVPDLVYAVIHNFNSGIYSLVWILCIASSILSFKQLSKKDKAQGE